MHIDQRNHGQTYKTFAATYEEAALPSGSFRYSGGRYIRRCMLKYYPNDRTATIELPTSEAARTLDSRKVKFGPPTQISVGPPKARPLSGDFLRKHHLCQKWVPRGAAPRSGSSILASPTMESSDFHSVPRAGKSIDFVYRMSLFEPPMVELSGKKFTVHDSSVLGAHRADASSMELSDASLSVALLTAGQDWEHQLSQQDDDPSRNDGTNGKNTDPGVEMGPDGYPIVWIKLHKKQGEQITTEIKPYRASYMRAALLLSSARQEAQRQVSFDTRLLCRTFHSSFIISCFSSFSVWLCVSRLVRREMPREHESILFSSRHNDCSSLQQAHHERNSRYSCGI